MMSTDPFDTSPIVPIAALFDSSGFGPNRDFDPVACLEEAEVIIGVDVMSQSTFLAFGARVLQEVVESGEPRPLATLRVGLDLETDELERFLALVKVIKGRHDFDSDKGDEPRPSIETEVSPTARRRLTQPEIDQAVNRACESAESNATWAPGKCFKTNFMKAGRLYAVAVDWRDNSYHAKIGMNGEIASA